MGVGTFSVYHSDKIGLYLAKSEIAEVFTNQYLCPIGRYGVELEDGLQLKIGNLADPLA